MPKTVPIQGMLKLLKNGVIISVVACEALPEPGAFLMPAELEKYHSFKIPKRKSDWLAGRYAAKTLVASALKGKNPADIEITRDTFGRPQAAGLTLSISHSQGTALAALKPGSGAFIGVDIEAIEDRSPAWYGDYFLPGEVPLPGDPDQATRIWTVKEAALKALGLGLQADLREACFKNESLKFSGTALERYREMGSPPFSLCSLRLSEIFWISAISA